MNICKNPECNNEIGSSSIGIGGYGVVCFDCGMQYLNNKKQFLKKLLELCKESDIVG